MFPIEINDVLIPLWSWYPNWVSWNGKSELHCSRWSWIIFFVLLPTLMSAHWKALQQSVVGLVGGWQTECQCLMRADGPQCPCNSSNQMWLMTSAFKLVASASKSELFKVRQAVNTKVPPQCLTQQVKHLLSKMGLSSKSRSEKFTHYGRPNGY